MGAKTNKASIVALDDDPVICKLLEKTVQAGGHAFYLAKDRFDVLDQVDSGSADLVLLDLGLPGDDGVDIARAIRSRSSLPLIMLTARDTVSDKVSGLDAGADDYLTKPVDPEELLARVRALLRRSVRSTGESADGPPSSVRFEGFHLDCQSRQLRNQAQGVCKLTNREHELLMCLLLGAGQARSRDVLCRQVNGRAWDPADRSLDVHVANLRKKLRRLGAPGDMIETIRNQGFRIHASPSWDLDYQPA